MSVLCLGEAIIDLFCERPVASLGEADAFVPHCGGAPANAAVAAAQCGAQVSLAGGVGDDAWGDWLVDRLAEHGVGLRWFGRLAGFPTPLAFVLVNEAAEPDFIVYGEGIEAGVLSVEDRLEDAIASHDALLFGSNTLLGKRERALTLRARELALAGGKHVLFDPNLRMRRWSDPGEPLEQTVAALAGATLLKVNRTEAELLTGIADPAPAADRLVSTSGVSPQAVAGALPRAVAAGARATEAWGALDSLPDWTAAG
jgi:fructokinase